MAGLQQALEHFVGGGMAQRMSKPLSACMMVGARSYLQLSSKDRKHVDEIVSLTLEYTDKLKPELPKIQRYITSLKVDDVTALIKLTTKLLKKKKTLSLLQEYLELYGDIVTDEQRMKATGAYLVCLVSNIEPEYKSAIVAAIDLVFTIIQLLSHSEIKGELRSKIGKLTTSVNKHVLKPLYKNLAKRR